MDAEDADRGGPCGDCAACPRSLGPRRGLPLGAFDAARRLPALGRALAVTGAECAVMLQSGSYGSISRPGLALDVQPGTIGLRIDPTRVARAALSTDRTGDPVLELLDETGHAAHRVRAHSPEDHAVLRALDPQLDAATAGALDPLDPVLAGAVDDWDGMDQLARIDDVLAGPAMRRRVAPGLIEHRHVDFGIVPTMLGRLASTGAPLGVGVFSNGLMQSCTGPVRAIEVVDGRLRVVFDDSTVEVGGAGLGNTILVRTRALRGSTTAIELHDRHGRCAVMLGQFGLVGAATHAVWEDLTAALPTAR